MLEIQVSNAFRDRFAFVGGTNRKWEALPVALAQLPIDLESILRTKGLHNQNTYRAIHDVIQGDNPMQALDRLVPYFEQVAKQIKDDQYCHGHWKDHLQKLYTQGGQRWFEGRTFTGYEVFWLGLSLVVFQRDLLPGFQPMWEGLRNNLVSNFDEVLHWSNVGSREQILAIKDQAAELYAVFNPKTIGLVPATVRGLDGVDRPNPAAGAPKPPGYNPVA